MRGLTGRLRVRGGQAPALRKELGCKPRLPRNVERGLSLAGLVRFGNKKIVDIQREFMVNFNQLFTVPNVLGVSREGKAMEDRR